MIETSPIFFQTVKRLKSPTSIIFLSLLSPEYREEVVRTVTYKAVKELKKTSIKNVQEEVYDACFKNRPYVLEWLINAYNITSSYIRKNNNQALRYACINGHLNIVKYLVSRFKMTIHDMRAMDCTIIKWVSLRGYTKLLSYLLSTFSFTKEDIENKNNRAVVWSKNKRTKTVLLNYKNEHVPKKRRLTIAY